MPHSAAGRQKMRKISFITLAVILCIILSGCELIAEKPQEKRIFMLSAGLDYKKTGASILNGTVNDQKAMISQMAYLAAKENTSFHSVAITGENGSCSLSTYSKDATETEAVQTSCRIGRDELKTVILEELDRLTGRIRPSDIFIFYYAGHGIECSDKGKEYLNGALVLDYFDTLPAIGYWHDDSRNLQKIISLPELESALSMMKGEKIIILDSCFSGSMVKDDPAITGTGDIKGAFSSLFSRGSYGNGNTYILSGARADQESYEDSSRGRVHGCFTASLLEALGYRFIDAEEERAGMPSEKKLTVSYLYDRLTDDRLLVKDQNPVMNEFYIDVILFSFR